MRGVFSHALFRYQTKMQTFPPSKSKTSSPPEQSIFFIYLDSVLEKWLRFRQPINISHVLGNKAKVVLFIKTGRFGKKEENFQFFFVSLASEILTIFPQNPKLPSLRNNPYFWQHENADFRKLAQVQTTNKISYALRSKAKVILFIGRLGKKERNSQSRCQAKI